MVVASAATVDMDTVAGEAIEIEQRDPEELLRSEWCAYRGRRVLLLGIQSLTSHRVP